MPDLGVPTFSVSVADANAALVHADTNAALVRRCYEAFIRGDVDAALGAFADDIFWHVPGRGPLSRDYQGRDEVLGFFGEFMKLSNGSFRLQVDDILAKGDTVVALVTESAERGGRAWSSPQVHVWTVADGRLARFWQYEGDQQTEDEFWA